MYIQFYVLYNDQHDFPEGTLPTITKEEKKAHENFSHSNICYVLIESVILCWRYSFVVISHCFYFLYSVCVHKFCAQPQQ